MEIKDGYYKPQIEGMEDNVEVALRGLSHDPASEKKLFQLSLHDLHNDFPLLPEQTSVAFEDLSDYQREMYDVVNSHEHTDEKTGEKYFKTKPFTSTPKLVATLSEKKNYVIHYRLLKYVLTLGMKIKKIHRAVSYKQEAYLKD